MIDARGLSCPTPVIMVQKEVKLNSPPVLEVLVDARVAVENIYEFQPRFDLGAWSFLTPKFLTTMTFVFMFISLAVIVALIVFLKKMTNKPEKQKKGEKGAKPAQQSIFPDAAFDFGDEEPRPIRNKKK